MRRRPEQLLLAALAGACVEGEAEPEPEPVAVPDGSESRAVQDWLIAGHYLEWERFDPPPSSDMVGGARVYLAPALVDSLEAGNEIHPLGSAAVREILDPEGEAMIGWALSHKLEAGAGPQTWFFYEVFALDADAEALVAERGASGCVGCHGEGVDHVKLEGFF